MARPPTPFWQEALVRVLLTLLLAWGLVGILGSMSYQWNWDVFWASRGQYWDGLLLTLRLSIGAMALALVLGTLAALGRLAHNIVLRHLADTYVELVRGTPLLVQIFIMWYGVYYVLGQAAATTGQPWLVTWSQNREMAGIVILGLFAGAYIAETIRAGIQSIDPGQREAGLAIGMTPSQVMRVVVFPQAFRRILPPLTGELIALIKDSSLLQIIGIAELTKKAYELNARSFKPFEAFLPLAVIYFALTWPLSLLTQALERRYGRR